MNNLLVAWIGVGMVACAGAAAQSDCAGRWLSARATVWGPGVRVSDSTAWDPDGAGPLPERLLCAGVFPSSVGTASVAWRDAENAAGWTAIGGAFVSETGGTFPVTAVAVYQGRPVAAGPFTSVDGVVAQRVAAFNGSSWEPLGSGVDATAVQLFVHGNDLFLAGTVPGPDSTQVWRAWRWDGASWTVMPESPWTQVRAFVEYNGEVWGIGTFRTPSGFGSPVARWDGSAWQPGPVAPVIGACATVHQGKIYIGAASAPQVPNSSGSQMVWSFDGTAAVYAGPQYGHYRAINSVASFGGALYVTSSYLSGDFSGGEQMQKLVNGAWSGVVPLAGGEVKQLRVWNGRMSASYGIVQGTTNARDGLVTYPTQVAMGEFNGSQWSPVGSGMDGYAQSMIEHDGVLYVGGAFAMTDGPTANVAKWDGVSFSSTSALGGVNGGVVSLVEHDGRVFAAGSFRIASGQPAIAAAYFDGSAWRQAGNGLTGLNEYACTMVEDAAHHLYVGGSFNRSGTTVVNNIAVLNSAGAWQPMSSGVNATVFSMTPVGTDLYVFGGSSSGGVPTQGMSRWNGTNWFAAPPVGQTAYSMATFNAQPVAAVQSGGPRKLAAGSWSPVGQPLYDQLGGGAFVSVVDGQLFSSGAIQGATAQANILVWTGSAWSAFHGGADGAVKSVARYHGETVISGTFTRVGSPQGATSGGVFSPRFARWTDTNAPWVARGPAARPIVPAGGALTLTAMSATGYEGVQFRWKRDGVALADGDNGHGGVVSGAATATLTITHAVCADAGEYVCEIYNDCGGEVSAPSRPVILGCCPADLGSAGGAVGPDGSLDNNDFVAFIALFFAGDAAADCGSAGGLPGADGQLDNNDFIVFIGRFFGGC